MLKIGTSPQGRQLLLSNLYIRNYLYGKYLTIEVILEDKLDQDGNVDSSVPLYMDINLNDSDSSQYIIDDNAVEYIKAAIEEQNKYNGHFKL